MKNNFLVLLLVLIGAILLTNSCGLFSPSTTNQETTTTAAASTTIAGATTSTTMAIGLTTTTTTTNTSASTTTLPSPSTTSTTTSTTISTTTTSTTTTILPSPSSTSTTTSTTISTATTSTTTTTVVGVTTTTIITSTTTTTIAEPTNLRGTSSLTGVTLFWDAVVGAHSYNLYWSNTSGVTKTNGTKIADVTSPYIHNNLVNGRAYYYVVTGVAVDNRESRESAEFVVVPQAVGALDESFNADGVVIYNGLSAWGTDVTESASGNLYVSGSIGLDLALLAFAENGEPLHTFGSDGVVRKDIAGSFDDGRALIFDQSGRLLVAGYGLIATKTSTAVLLRYDDSGHLDTSFGISGLATFGASSYTYNGWEGLALDSAGRIFAGGYYSQSELTSREGTIACYNDDGWLDLSFDGTGFVTYGEDNKHDYCQAVAVNSSGQVLACGTVGKETQDVALLRYEASGVIDETFDVAGLFSYDFGHRNDLGRALVLDNSGRILLLGFYRGSYGKMDTFVMRLLNDGVADPAFSVISLASSTFDIEGDFLALDKAGKILVAGRYGNDIFLRRYDSNGQLDTLFGDNGQVLFDHNLGIDSCIGGLVDHQGRIVLVGSVNAGNGLLLLRYK